MPGITTRTVTDQALESIKAIYDADTDIAADFVGGTTIGPFAPDPETGIVTITPRMINLMVAPNHSFRPGTSGVNTQDIPIVVSIYDYFVNEPYTPGVPNVTPMGRREYLERKLANGSEADGSGKLVNPDDPTSPFPKIKYLNENAPYFTTLYMGRPVHISETQKNVARLYAFIAIYETRVTNVTRARA